MKLEKGTKIARLRVFWRHGMDDIKNIHGLDRLQPYASIKLLDKVNEIGKFVDKNSKSK